MEMNELKKLISLIPEKVQMCNGKFVPARQDRCAQNERDEWRLLQQQRVNLIRNWMFKQAAL